MKKFITLENLGTFLGECKKVFALKTNVPTNDEVNSRLYQYVKTMDMNSTIANELKPYAKTADLDVYAKKSDITKAVHYRGSVDTFDDLPKSGVLVGDMYNVVKADTMHGVKAGDNVCYNGNEWDNMGGTVDLSDYATKSDVEKAVMGGIQIATESEVTGLF